LTIIIEVPETSGSFFVYSGLGQANDADVKLVILEMCMKANFLQQEVRGACLGMDPSNNDIMLSYTARVTEITSADFRNILQNFIDNAMTFSRKVKTILGKESLPVVEEPNETES